MAVLGPSGFDFEDQDSGEFIIPLPEDDPSFWVMHGESMSKEEASFLLQASVLDNDLLGYLRAKANLSGKNPGASEWREYQNALDRQGNPFDEGLPEIPRRDKRPRRFDIIHISLIAVETLLLILLLLSFLGGL